MDTLIKIIVEIGGIATLAAAIGTTIALKNTSLETGMNDIDIILISSWGSMFLLWLLCLLTIIIYFLISDRKRKKQMIS